MASISFCYHIHLPVCIKSDYSFFDIGVNHIYEDKIKTSEVCSRLSSAVYIPFAENILSIIKKSAGRFKFALSVTGITLEKFLLYNPEVINILVDIHDTGCMEITAGTFNHSPASLFSADELKEQLLSDMEIKQTLFGIKPVTLRDTYLLAGENTADAASYNGFKTILADSPPQDYLPPLPGIVNNSSLSLSCTWIENSDITILFNSPPDEIKSSVNKQNKHYNLFINTAPASGSLHAGSWQIYKSLIMDILENRSAEFIMPCEISKIKKPADGTSMSNSSSVFNNISFNNSMQKTALKLLYKLEAAVRNSGCPDIIGRWRNLQEADIYLAMGNSGFYSADLCCCFKTPYDAFITCVNMINDLEELTKKKPCFR